jgi:putative transposase
VITRSQYLVTKPKFLLQRLTEFLPDKYNFYTGDLLNCLDRANIIQDMKRLQAYKFRIEPTGEQQRAMRRIAGTCRFVWNKALALQIANHQQGQKFVNHFDMCKWLPVWKKEPETLWLKDTPSQLYQVVLKDLARAYKNFFDKRADFPTFKKKGASTSFCFPQGCELDAGNRRIRFPKLGWLRYRKSRVVEGTIKNIIVSCVAGKWYASIQTEREVTQPVHSSTSIIGIDLGVTRFATLSDGTVFEPVNALRKYSDTLAKHQRCLSRKTKFSSNWKKQKQKISRLHHRVAQTRHDFLHKTSTLISKNHAMIVLEDLKVTNMSKSASGTVQAPGCCVKAKSGLNKSILDQGWGEFRRQLEYKQAWRGGEVLAIDPSNTSRTCPACKHVSAENRTTQAKFECVECGFAENADLTAAINIVRAGHARLACQVNGAIIPSATGTHRSDRPHPEVYAVGIPVL